MAPMTTQRGSIDSHSDWAAGYGFAAGYVYSNREWILKVLATYLCIVDGGIIGSASVADWVF